MQPQSGRRAALLLLAGLIAAALPLRGQAQTALAPQAIGSIEDVFADIEESAPGCAAGVVVNEELAYAGGFGLANLDHGLPITPRSSFYLGSIGKQFTAAAIAHAEQAGHLSLDDPIQRWVPEIPEYDRPITIRHLIHHTSGIRDYLGLGNLSGWRIEDVHTSDEILALIARQLAPNFPAGDEYLYSNSGYFLLSVIIERATGMSLREYAQNELLEPLGMHRTRVHDDRGAVIPDRVVGYRLDDGAYRIDHPWNFDQVGSGGVYSSIEDLVHWDRNYYTEEVGGTGFSQRLRQRGVLVDGDTISYAFGLSHGEYRGLSTIGHGGALAGFRSQLLRFPDERTTILVLCNFPTSDPGARARKVADAVLADRLEPTVASEVVEDEATETDPAAVELAPAQLDAFTGHWRASMGIEVEIRRDRDGLVFLQGTSRSPLSVVSDSVLRLTAADIEMTFSDRVDGKYNAQAVVQRGRPFTAERFDPESEVRSYSDILGEYYSNELDATYRLYESDQGLSLEIPPTRRARVYQIDEDRIRAPNMVLELKREAGEVVGFTIDAGRVRGIYFERR